MGVLQCDREDCKNVMADYYSEEVGYICRDCLNELEEYLYTHPLTVNSIREFMGMERIPENNSYEDVADFINRYVKER